ncbi:four helix bundle protein [Candidatus Falkowbacteria bacterium]|nr:four helix bundle protein [Candidatus Falkowbacteria bacterium]
MEKFRSLKVWQKSHYLVLEVYKVTRDYPDFEKFGLVSQMRRSSVSVVANIVEGSKKVSIKDRKHFHVIADASLEELKYYFILSYNLKYIDSEVGKKLMECAREVGRMLSGLTKSLSK